MVNKVSVLVLSGGRGMMRTRAFKVFKDTSMCRSLHLTLLCTGTGEGKALPRDFRSILLLLSMIMANDEVPMKATSFPTG